MEPTEALYQRNIEVPTADYTLVVFHMQGSFPNSAEVLAPVLALVEQAKRDDAGVVITDTASGSCVRKSLIKRLARYRSWDRAYFDGDNEAETVCAICETHEFARGHFVICGPEADGKLAEVVRGLSQRYPQAKIEVVKGASFDSRGQNLWPELTPGAAPNLVLSETFVTVPPPPKPVQEKRVGPKKPSLHILRHMAVHEALKESGARSILDLGCGGWLLLERLVQEPQFERFLGVETLESQLGHAQRRGERKAVDADVRIEAISGSVLEFDPRMAGFDAATMVEVIEHLPPETLAQLARTLFGQTKPRTVVITTPNAECNRFIENMLPNGFREPSHKFEWTRADSGVGATRLHRTMATPFAITASVMSAKIAAQ